MMDEVFSGCHYIRLFAVYVVQSANSRKVVAPLLDMSPMSMQCQCGKDRVCTCAAETTQFDAKTDSDHINSIFELCKLILKTGLIGTLLNIPHVTS